MTRLERTLLVVILLVGTVVRLWDFPSYFPQFWDETKYLEEVEGLTPFFSVNAGAYAFLKLGQLVSGASAYPQIVTAIFGILTVMGLYLLGRRLLHHRREGIWLGLLMAGQAAVMPYFIRYSRNAFPTGFALCFFIFALYFYLRKLEYPKVRKARDQWGYLRAGFLAAGLLACVPACSFKFFLPTLIFMITIEIFIWRIRGAHVDDFRAPASFIVSIFTVLIFLAAMPLIMATVSGYSGWLERALSLSANHTEIGTLRPAYHFLYPVHLYYLAGPIFLVCVIAGPVFLYYRTKPGERVSAGGRANWLMFISCAVSLLFFGLYSHLQAARIFALTLPLVVYTSALVILRLPRLLPRYGQFAAIGIYSLLIVSMAYLSFDYLKRSTGIPGAVDAITAHARPGQSVWANATVQVNYGLYFSRFNNRAPQTVTTFLRPAERKFDAENPPIIVIQDAVDLATLVVAFDKYDQLNTSSIDDIRMLSQDIRSVARGATQVYSAPDNFYTSPHYYLEEVYSWQSFWYIHKLMAEVRDSVYVYAPGSP